MERVYTWGGMGGRGGAGGGTGNWHDPANWLYAEYNGPGLYDPQFHYASLTNGRAATSFRAPPIGTGYRVHVEDAQDPAVSALSRAFSVGPDLRLLLAEGDGALLTEAGGRLVQ